jgi:hypothetical protein
MHYSPVRHSPPGASSRAAVRLACVKHAASVQSEPGSNSSVQFPTNLLLTAPCRAVQSLGLKLQMNLGFILFPFSDVSTCISRFRRQIPKNPTSRLPAYKHPHLSVVYLLKSVYCLHFSSPPKQRAAHYTELAGLVKSFVKLRFNHFLTSNEPRII